MKIAGWVYKIIYIRLYIPSSSSYLTTVKQGKVYHYTYFIDKKTEALKGKGTCIVKSDCGGKKDCNQVFPNCVPDPGNHTIT